MKVELKKNNMRTQQYSQIEAIVAKYRTLASNTEEVKKAEQDCSSVLSPDFFANQMRLSFVEQLLAHIYQLRAGDAILVEVVEEYDRVAKYYIAGLLSSEEEEFLVKNFNLFVDYAFEKTWSLEISAPTPPPTEWSELVPLLLRKLSGKIFIAHSDKGREFVGMNKCDLIVDSGFADAAIRAVGCGHTIRQYKKSESDTPLWSDLADELFDAVIIKAPTWQTSITVEDCFSEAYRIVRKGGELLFSVSREDLLGEKTESLRHRLMQDHTLQKAIQLPSGDVLLHVVKKVHDTFVMVDATDFSKKSDEKIVDVEAFLKEVRMDGLQECDNKSICCRHPYHMLNQDMLLPSYYLHFTTSGKLSDLIECVEYEVVLSDECTPDEKVLKINHLSKIFTKGAFKINDLPTLSSDRLRSYYRIEGPAVVIAVSEHDIAIGYTTDEAYFLVPRNLYPLKPRKGIDVKYLACVLLSEYVKKQLVSLVSGPYRSSAQLVKDWSKLIFLEELSERDQQSYIQETILRDFAAQERYAALQDNGYKHAIRLRKHALSQNISAFDSMFRTLEHCMNEHKGNLKASDFLSPVSQMTVADAMLYLHASLDTISERVASLSDDQDWGGCEAIEPQQFIKEYEQQHVESSFKFGHLWDSFETNCFSEDIFDNKTGKLLFYKGESMNSAWFPRKALMQVFDNIVTNAREHGFKVKSRHDYEIQFDWYSDGLNMLIKISNNGAPMPSDLDTDLVLEYGYTSALNQKGHGGIGGGEIAEIMHRYGGDVKVVSTPEKKFTVTYILTLPLASLY